MKTKPIYLVHAFNSIGLGLQPVKADNQKEAKNKYKKRFPKHKIVDAHKADKESERFSYWKQNAI